MSQPAARRGSTASPISILRSSSSSMRPVPRPRWLGCADGQRDPADPRRRVFRVAVVDCPAIPVTGTTFIDYNDIDIVDMFITEPAGDPGDFLVFLEVIRSRDADDSTDIINDTRLVE